MYCSVCIYFYSTHTFVNAQSYILLLLSLLLSLTSMATAWRFTYIESLEPLRVVLSVNFVIVVVVIGVVILVVFVTVARGVLGIAGRVEGRGRGRPLAPRRRWTWTLRGGKHQLECYRVNEVKNITHSQLLLGVMAG